MRSNLLWCGAFWSLVVLAMASRWSAAEDPKPADAEKTQAERFKKFSDSMKDVTLKGHFTILGKAGEKEEEYQIKSVKKSEDGDFWIFNARVKYGGKDTPMVFPLEVKWAGPAPVVVMEEYSIPGLGTFSCRVVFENDRYAGTWSHGEVKGHLYGTITKTPAKEEK